MEVEIIFTYPPKMGGYHSKYALRLGGKPVEGVFVEEDGSLNSGGAEIIFFKFMPLTVRGINEYKKWVLSILDKIHDEYGDMETDESCGLHISFKPEELAKKPAMMIALELAWQKYATQDMKERYFRHRYSVPLLRYDGRYTAFAYRNSGRRVEWRAPNLGITKNYAEVRERLLLVFRILTEAVKIEKKIRRVLQSLEKNRNKYILTFARGGVDDWNFHYVFYSPVRYLIDIRWWGGAMELGFSGRSLKNSLCIEFLPSKEFPDETQHFENSELFMTFYVPYFLYSSLIFLRKLKKKAYYYYEYYTLQEIEKKQLFNVLEKTERGDNNV